MSTITESAAATGTRRVDQLLAHYGESHRDPRNSAIHCVAIPLIMASLVGLLYAAHPWLAYAFLLASMVYYARLGSWVFLVSMAAISVLGLAIVHAIVAAHGGQVRVEAPVHRSGTRIGVVLPLGDTT